MQSAPRPGCPLAARLIRGQGSNADPSWLDHNEIVCQPVHMNGDDLRDTIRLLVIRKPVQFQQHHAAHVKRLTDDQVAKIAIFGNKDAGLGPR